MKRHRGWKTTFPPLSHDDSYEVPTIDPGETPAGMLQALRCQTVYLEYAALALRAAETNGSTDQVARFKRVIEEIRENVHRFSPFDETEHLIELARVCIDLRETEQAKELLRDAVCRIPAGHVKRLPLLVDMAILQPEGADSVLKGVGRLLNVSDNGLGMSLERQALDCAWPVPVDLPSRLRRLTWELNGTQALRAYRIALVLYRKVQGPPWNEPTEQNWALDAVSLLKEKHG
jgi:hypothetical protein